MRAARHAAFVAVRAVKVEHGPVPSQRSRCTEGSNDQWSLCLRKRAKDCSPNVNSTEDVVDTVSHVDVDIFSRTNLFRPVLHLEKMPLDGVSLEGSLWLF